MQGTAAGVSCAPAHSLWPHFRVRWVGWIFRWIKYVGFFVVKMGRWKFFSEIR